MNQANLFYSQLCFASICQNKYFNVILFNLITKIFFYYNQYANEPNVPKAAPQEMAVSCTCASSSGVQGEVDNTRYLLNQYTYWPIYLVGINSLIFTAVMNRSSTSG
ncbi:hypothetical protein Cni_G19775 [Canna indica]|uniref:Uncharacterized protein n=1 Tax=Canna indica TaxID=4628 RepID=A0AAQ3KMP7_9LILI|nr:hypothetical protein Cni_G19775 [Canna indica]